MADILLDTNILIFSASGQLSKEALLILDNPANTLFFSPVSFTEIAIKMNSGKLDMPVSPNEIVSALLENGYKQLPYSTKHALGLMNLKDIHKDPFDRMLISQAIVENIQFLTSDKTLAKYSPLVKAVAVITVHSELAVE